MGRTVAIGIQDFGDLIKKQCFYVDKTNFIKEWWESEDSVTLIARPRRFGKTLNMSMLEYFFSNRYEGKGELFSNLSIWEEEKYRDLQGTYPVISFSFASVKETNYEFTVKRILELLMAQFEKYAFLVESDKLLENDKGYINRMRADMTAFDAATALHRLCECLCRHYGRKVIILLDEYDTPMQEAYVNGFWEELVAFTRSLFNATFKTNPYMERAIMTGITRVSKGSDFSDLNNLKVVTTTSDEYADSFGFTEAEVFAGLDECGLGNEKEEVKRWYDGFVFGQHKDIYNPWSILNFLDTGKYDTYWANTSSNSLVSKLIRESSHRIKQSFEELLKGEHLRCPIDEQIVYNQLDASESAIWSLLLAAGYLKVVDYDRPELLEEGEKVCYELTLTNYEVKQMFERMVSGWFMPAESDYNDFIKALLTDDLDAMNEYMNRVAEEIFSSFDTGTKASKRAQPERFYHGFVLGLLVDLQNRYYITSNRESGFGRYDVALRAKGIPQKKIHRYGFAFEGKNVLIG